jgi:hypothetical protein
MTQGNEMGFWPFGREPSNIEMASRVITAATQNGYRLRGKLTIHFSEPQRQADADAAADRCASLAVALLRAAPDHGHVIGAETQLGAELTARYLGDAAPARAIELAALHVVGDPTLSDELRRAYGTGPLAVTPRRTSSSGSMKAVVPPAEPPSAPPPRSNPPSAAAPAPSAPLPYRRRGSSQIRSIQSLLMPPGTPPSGMAAFVAPVVRDSAARLLIGFLRAHDLIHLRDAAIEDSAEMLANLVPVSDAPPGGYEASRAGEIARWQAALGPGVMSALQRELKVISVYLAKEALARVEVMPTLADAVVEALCAAAFAGEAGLLGELGRFPGARAPEFVGVVAENLTRIAHQGEGDPAAVSTSLAPLVGMVQEDLNVAAMIIKASSGG